MVCLVRSEDRKPSRRVFPLLQNLDLDTVTFAQVQSTGDPISIEDMNEQEMVDLIIVNLARLCVAGEWTGLLEAGASATSSMILPSDTASGARYLIAQTPPWGSADQAGTWNASVTAKPMCFPFIAPASGDVTEIGLQFTTASTGNVYVGIYDTKSDGMCQTRLGYATIDATGTGGVYQTSITGTATLVAGTQYYFSIGLDTGGSAPYLMAGTTVNTPGMGLGGTVNQNGVTFYDNSVSANAIPPATFTSSYTYASQQRPICSLKIA